MMLGHYLQCLPCEACTYCPSWFWRDDLRFSHTYSWGLSIHKKVPYWESLIKESLICYLKLTEKIHSCVYATKPWLCIDIPIINFVNGFSNHPPSWTKWWLIYEFGQNLLSFFSCGIVTISFLCGKHYVSVLL